MKSIFLLIGLIIACNACGQNKIVERKEKTENGITQGWTITKELDQDGNVINYDSSYYEKESGDLGVNSFQFRFDGSGSPDIDFFNYQFDTLGLDNNFRFFNYPGGHINQFQFGFSDSLLNNYRDHGWGGFKQRMKDHQQRMDEFFKKFQFPVKPDHFNPLKEEELPKGEKI